MEFSSVTEMFRLDGRTALVTGSSRGIGRAIGLTLAAAGARVMFHGSKESAALEAAAREGSGEWIAADLGNDAECDRLAGETLARFGHLDILVLNASAQEYVRLGEYSEEEMLREFQINFGAAFRLIERCVPGMRERRWGRILTIGSVNQFRPSPRLTLYSATKTALRSLTVNFAKSLAADGITCNNLAPGVILTDRNDAVLSDPQMRQMMLNVIPAGRFGEVSECTGAALLLCSPAGSYITGAELAVTGGMHL